MQTNNDIDFVPDLDQDQNVHTVIVAQNSGTDTVAGGTNTGHTISVGGNASGFVNTAGDQDWYRVTLTAGQTYTISLAGSNGLDTIVRLLDANGTQLAINDDSGRTLNSLLTFTASSGGTYYISAQGWNTSTGGYSLSVNEASTPEYSIPQIADQLINGHWTSTGYQPHHWASYNLTFNVQGLSAERAAIARLAFATWGEVCGLTFTEAGGAAAIMLDDTDSGAYSNTSWVNGIIQSSSINVEPGWFGGTSAMDSYTFETFIHEIGHSLGLGHSGNYNGSATYGVDNHYLNDTTQYSVMSYFDQSYFGGASYRYVMTPQMADIYAVISMYGAGEARTGNTVYGFHASGQETATAAIYSFDSYSNAPSFTIYDTGGTDTLDCSGYSYSQTISLVGGTWSDIGGLNDNIGIYITSAIENAIGGSGNDTVILSAENVRNIVDGNGGADTVFVDYYYGSGYTIQAGSIADNLTMSGLEGIDTFLNVEYVHFADGSTRSTASLVSGGQFSAPTFELAAFGPGAGGWSNDDTYPRMLADVNGDGRADIVGFGGAGAYVSLATGSGHFSAPTFELAAFAPNAGGWGSDNTYPRMLGDVNGDGRDDIVGVGNAGVYVSLATGNGHFANPTFELATFAPGAGGWSSDDTYPRMLGDVNGDGRDDIVGFGNAGVYVSLATGNGHFANPTFELAAFAPNAGGWGSDNTYPRMLGDVNGDGRDDIVGVGNAGVYVSLATGNGHFANPTFELAAFAPGAGGWSSDDTYPRMLGDVDGDGRDDIVGFGNAGAYVSLATGNGHFAAPRFDLDAFAPGAGGWSSDDTFPRMLADITGDGRDDIVGFGGAGVYASLASGSYPLV